MSNIIAKNNIQRNAVGEYYSKVMLDFAKYLASKIFDETEDGLYYKTCSTREQVLWGKYFSEREGIFPNYRNRELNCWIDEIPAPAKKEEELVEYKGKYIYTEASGRKAVIEILGPANDEQNNLLWRYWDDCVVRPSVFKASEL